MSKLSLLIAGGVGYVLGARAGRERYEQIVRTATRVKDDPRVQDTAQRAAEVAREQAPVVKDKVTAAAGAAASKVTGSSSDDDLESRVQPMAGPQGDLP